MSHAMHAGRTPDTTLAPEDAACPSHIRELTPQGAAWRISDAHRIQSIIAALSAVHAEGVIHVEDPEEDTTHELDSPGTVTLLPGPRLLASAECWDGGGQRPWTVELQGPYSLVRFRLDADARLRGGHFLPPPELQCVYRRSERRVSAPPSAKLRISRETTPDTWLERPLRDMGFRGLQFVTLPDDNFTPGEQFRGEMTWKHGPRIQLTAEVRYVTVNEQTNERLCGVAVHAESHTATQIWQRELSSLLHPNTQMATRRIADQLWELYDVSGYFGLDGRNASKFEHLKPAFLTACEKLEGAPTLGCCIVRECQGRAEATMSLLRCWSGAWLLYQGARRQDNNPLGLAGNAVLRDMFMHAFELALQDVHLRWHVTFIRYDAHFSRLSNYDFAKPRVDDKNVSIVPFRAVEVSCRRSATLGTRTDIEIDAASDWELRVICATLAKRFPTPYLEAYDFVAERCKLAGLKSEWSKSNLLRERAIIVARRRGHPLAAAILDLVEDGVHLVGLLNSAHLISLHSDGVACFPYLLEAAQHFYAAHDIGKFVLFEETGDLSYAGPFDFLDLGEANQIFFASSLTPEFLDHITFITAPRSFGGIK